jgi:hypothetical protein
MPADEQRLNSNAHFVRVARDQFGYRQMFLHHVIDETRFSGPILNAPRVADD